MKLRLTSAARADIRTIFEYVAAHDLEAAAALVRRILDALDPLLSYPQLGREGSVAETRELVIKGTPYIAVYRIERSLIRLLRVRHSAQRWPPAG